MTVLLVLLILVVLVVVHECGHFVAAKLCGVHVEEFGIGYPPRALTMGHFGGTEYTLNWLPFGGFVRLFGDEGDKQAGAGALRNAGRMAQALILIAGVAMNVIMGCALFTIAFHIGVPRVVAEESPASYVLVTGVVAGSPAAAAGMRGGDTITGITDQHGTALSVFTPDAISDFVSQRGGQNLSISYARAGVANIAHIRPAHAIILDEANRPALGVGLALVNDTPLSWYESMCAAMVSVRNTGATVTGGLWRMVTGVFSGKTSMLSEMVGPVGLVKIVGDAAHNGFGNVLALAGFISVNLAIINLIPIPALDGGRIVLLGVEAIRRKDVPRYVVQLLNGVGIICVILLMVVVTYHDIVRLLM